MPTVIKNEDKEIQIIRTIFTHKIGKTFIILMIVSSIG